MIKIKRLIICLFVCCAQSLSAQNFKPVEELAQIQFPWIANKLIVKGIPLEQGKDVFNLETADNKLIISASSVSAATRGLDWYLKHYCNQSISHLGNNVKKLNKLPEISGNIKKTSFVPYRYALTTGMRKQSFR